MTIQLNRRSFLGTLAAVALLGRAIMKAEPKPVETTLPKGMHSIPMNRIKFDSRTARQPDRFVIKMLASDMGTSGLHNPIFIHSNGRLIDGLYRYSAAQDLGWTHIMAWVV